MSIKEIKLPLMVEHAISLTEFAGPLTVQMVASVGNNVKCQTRVAIPLYKDRCIVVFLSNRQMDTFLFTIILNTHCLLCKNMNSMRIL